MADNPKGVVVTGAVGHYSRLARVLAFLDSKDIDYIISDELEPMPIHELMLLNESSFLSFKPEKRTFSFRGGSKKKGGKTKYKRT